MTGPESLRQLAREIEDLGRKHGCWSQVHQIVLNATDHICAVARIEELNGHLHDPRHSSPKTRVKEPKVQSPSSRGPLGLD